MLIKTYRLRLYVMYIVPFVAMIGLLMRLYYVQVMQHDFWQKLADEQHFSKVSMIPVRGKIYDSNGHELAGSIILDAGYLELARMPKEIGEGLINKLANKLASSLNLSYDKVFAQLSGKYNKSPLLARELTDKDKVEIRNILHEFRSEGIPPNLVEFRQENKRRYSSGDLAPHVVGFTQRDIIGETGDNKGVMGVENSYDTELKGRKEKYITRTSATGNPMEPADPEVVESTYGHSVKLTINESLQRVTQIVLGQGVDNSRADSGVAICYHVKTGEILALANYPSFDVNHLEGTTVTQTKNRAVSDAIEPGSVMKIVTFTSLFDDNLYQPSDYINCENGAWRIPGINRLVTDSHSAGSVPISEVFQYSSNIGTIKAAQKFDKKTFYEHIKKFGFGEYTGVDLPNESRGRLRDYKSWDSWSMSSLPMGYEMQVTGVQVVSAVGAVANKGVRLRPHVVKEIIDHSGTVIKRIQPEELGRVASPAACRKVIDLMELVVEKGTAKPAKLEGYRVGGKTGTTKKVGKYGYEKAYIAGFCGIAPIEDPEVCIYVYIDNPRGESFYGGSVAGPVFREIAREAMRVLRIPQNKATMPPDEFQIALHKVRKQINGDSFSELNTGLTDSEEEVTSGTVPLLRGLSMAEAVKRAAAAGLEVRVSGSGTVVEQDPPPYETIEGKAVVTLTLTNTRQSIKKLVEDFQELTEKEDGQEIAESAINAEEPLHTSVSLKLTSGDETIPLAVNAQPEGLWGRSSANRRSKEPEEEKPLYPDLDQYAQKPLDPQIARQTWANFQKEYNELEKKQRTGSEPKGTPEEAIVGTQSSVVPTDRPIPDLDGSEEIDPVREDAKPVFVRPPTNAEKHKSAPKAETSKDLLYNL